MWLNLDILAINTCKIHIIGSNFMDVNDLSFQVDFPLKTAFNTTSRTTSYL